MSILNQGADAIARAAQAVKNTGLFNELTLQHRISPYLEYFIDTYFVWMQGTLQLPVYNTTAAQATAFPGVTTYQNFTPTAAIQPCSQSTAVINKRPSAEIVQSSAPYCTKVVVISARRVGSLPVLPDPTPTDCNLVLQSSQIHLGQPEIMPDMKSRIFSARAEYRYLMKQPIWVPLDQVSYPISAADGYSRSQYVVTPPQFVQGLI